MKFSRFRARLLALPLVLAPFFSAYSQTPTSEATLKEALVTATRFADTASDLPFGVSVITSEEIKRSGAATVNEAIMKLLAVPGRLDFYGGGDYALDLRGFGTTAASNQVVIVDGIRLNEADGGGTRLAGISIDSVDQIEVIRGSGAVLYGEGATGGVIVITTKAGKGVVRKNSASVYAATGSLGLREARANATVASGGFSLDVSSNKRQADNHRDNFKSNGDGGSVAGQWSNDWLRLGARYNRDELQTGLPGSLTAAQYAANPQQTTNPTKSATLNNSRKSVFAEAVLADWQLGFDAGNRSKNLDSLTAGVPTYRYEIDANTVAVRAKHQSNLGSSVNALIIGLDQADWSRAVIGGATSRQTSNAFYVKNDLKLVGGTRLSAGLRTDSIQKSVSSVAAKIDERPRAWELGLSHPFAKDISVYGRVGQSYRLANIDEFGYTIPGVALNTQTSHDIELGNRLVRGPTSIDVRWYKSDLTNELAYDANANAGNGANVNLDPTRRQGVEFESRYALNPSVNLRLNAAVREARFVSGAYAGKHVPLVPAKTLAFRADWSPALGHRLDGGVNWVSTQNPDMANLCTMPAYTTMDLRYSYQYKNAELALGLNNLTDNKYYTQAFNCSAGVTSSIYPEAGRTLVASMRLRF